MVSLPVICKSIFVSDLKAIFENVSIEAKVLPLLSARYKKRVLHSKTDAICITGFKQPAFDDYAYRRRQELKQPGHLNV